MIRSSAHEGSAVETALADAERKGFRLAVIGRTCALVPFAVFYLVAFPFPNNVNIAGLIVATGLVGLVPLTLVGTRFEYSARYVLFAIDVAAISSILAFAPMSLGSDVPQNFVFFSGRDKYFYVVVAVSILTLSPSLVLWTGSCAVAGLAGATLWIMSEMDRVVSYRDLPPSPTRDEFLTVLFNPDFLSLGVRVTEGIVIALITLIAALAVHRARNVVRAHAATEEKRAHIQRMFGRYVPPQVAEQLIESGQLAPQQREASILFADIEGFTRLSESMTPAQVIGVLNSYFSAATAIVDARGGMIVNHVGDAIIAAFNAPLPVSGHAVRAVEVARDLLALVSAREFEGRRLRLRIGVATGPVAAGTVGGAERQTYTLYGDTVNLAQRLEGLNKEFQTSGLICGATFNAARSACTDVTAKGAVQVRGRAASVEVFAISDNAPRPSPS